MSAPDEPRRVPFTDKRHGASAADALDSPTDQAGRESMSAEPTVHAEEIVEDEKHDYLADLQRLQAEFENYRKRMMRDQAGIAERAAGRLMESMLPILDNFERAIAHGEGGEGVALVFRQLKETLAKEGLEEVPSEGREFDPQMHEAIAAHEDAGVSTAVVREVSRRGYSYKGQLLRPAMVVVATPPQTPVVEEHVEGSEQTEEITETYEDA